MSSFKIGNTQYAQCEKKIANVSYTTITLQDTKDKLQQKKRSEIVSFSYESMKDYIESKYKFSKNKKYKINVFTSFGWRSGDMFKGDEIEWFDAKEKYGQQSADIQDIYGIQIIEFNE